MSLTQTTMSDQASLEPSAALNDDKTARHLELLVASVDWDALAFVMCSLHDAPESRLDQLSRGYNVVRFLHIDDTTHTALVGHMPCRLKDGWIVEYARAFAPGLFSGLQLCASRASIPVLRVVYYSVEADGLISYKRKR
jgi:hypothetical protein